MTEALAKLVNLLHKITPDYKNTLCNVCTHPQSLFL